MRLEDLLIMEVPRKALQHVTAENKLKPGGNAIEDYAKVIVSNPNTISMGEHLVEEYRYAGQTAVSIYQPLSGIPIEFNDKEQLKRHLIHRFGQALFQNGIRPELSEIPKLYKIEEIGNKWVISLTYYGREIRVLRNYELNKERPQYVDFVVLHFNPLLIEFRVAANKIPMFQEALSKILGVDENIEWINFSQLSDREAKTLKEVLNGGVIGAKHKMTEGIYDTVEVKAVQDVEDLFQEEEYQETFSGKPFRSITFRFAFKHTFGLEEELSLRITPTGVSFYSAASEDVIQFVIQQMINIKLKTIEQIAAAKEVINR